MHKTLKPGDKVSWGTAGGDTHGMVKKKVTGITRIKSHAAKATKTGEPLGSTEEPQFVVKSAKSGKAARME